MDLSQHPILSRYVTQSQDGIKFDLSPAPLEELDRLSLSFNSSDLSLINPELQRVFQIDYPKAIFLNDKASTLQPLISFLIKCFSDVNNRQTEILKFVDIIDLFSNRKTTLYQFLNQPENIWEPLKNDDFLSFAGGFQHNSLCLLKLKSIINSNSALSDLVNLILNPQFFTFAELLRLTFQDFINFVVKPCNSGLHGNCTLQNHIDLSFNQSQESLDDTQRKYLNSLYFFSTAGESLCNFSQFSVQIANLVPSFPQFFNSNLVQSNDFQIISANPFHFDDFGKEVISHLFQIPLFALDYSFFFPFDIYFSDFVIGFTDLLKSNQLNSILTKVVEFSQQDDFLKLKKRLDECLENHERRTLEYFIKFVEFFIVVQLNQFESLFQLFYQSILYLQANSISFREIVSAIIKQFNVLLTIFDSPYSGLKEFLIVKEIESKKNILEN